MRRASLSATNEWLLGRGGGRGAWWCHECEEGLTVVMMRKALKMSVSDELFTALVSRIREGSKKAVVVEE
jgi:hypothetical protein